MAETKGYSLWFIPDNEIYDMLSDLISKLSSRLHTPVFEPHLTLIGEVEGEEKGIIQKTEELASAIRPFEITLTRIGYLDHFFRCLFIRAEESGNLLKANEKAKEIFGRMDDPKYMPHLSLVYGNLTEEKKKDVIAETGENFGISFVAGSIHLVKTTGETTDWKKIKEFPFK